MTGVSTFRLYLMRATYLLIAAGLGFEIWPGLIQHDNAWALWRGVGASLLAAVSILAALGILYPVQMLPVLLFELVWKAIWLVLIALPSWSSNQLDASMWETIYACLMGIVLMPIVIPWTYVFVHYVPKPSGGWA